MIPAHKQIWVKVNAQVDEGIAGLIDLLNSVPGLQTIESCQGLPVANPAAPGEPMAYVYFYYGDWRTISLFAFGFLAELLTDFEESISISVEIFNRSQPLGKLSISAGAIPALVDALRQPIALHAGRESTEENNSGSAG